MKKFLALVMAMILCLSMLTACDTPKDEEDVVYAVAEAAAYLNSLYKDKAAETPVDYDVVAKVVLDQVTYTVTWSVNNDQIKIVESSKNGFYTVDVPDVTEEEIPYVLTATIKAGDGTSVSKSFNRVVPVVDNSGLIGEPEENVAYKIYLKQASLNQVLYVSHEITGGKYYQGIADPTAAPDFYAEKVGEGYKFYTMIDGVKSYVRAYLQDTPTGPSKRLDYSATEGTVWTYKADCNAWFTTIDGGSYVFGTYNSYNTFCISDGTFMTPEASGVSQFPAELILKEDAEAQAPSDAPTIYETPEEIVNAAYALETGATLSGAHEYTLTGVITTVDYAYSEQHGNITVTIVVAGLTDKPIQCFRLSGDGAETLKIGDTITVTGVIKNYNGKVEFDYPDLVSVVAGEGGDDPEPPVNNDPAADSVLSIVDAIALGASKAHNTYTAGKYYVTGEIVEIYDTTYGNMRIKDADGNILTIYGTYSADGSTRFDKMETKPAVGDTITVYGIIGQYNDTPQMKSGWLGAEPAGDGGEGDDVTPTPGGMTIADALNAAEGTEVVLTGKVVEIYEKWNDTYKNIAVYIEDDNGDRILAYRTKPTHEAPVYIGDVITVEGTITFYGSANQIAKDSVATLVSSHTCADYATDASCTAASVCSSCNAELAPALTHPTDDDGDGICDNCGLGTDVETETVVVSIADHADANGWENGTKYTTLTMDENIAVTVSGGSNTGKYYTSGENWRIYQNETPSIVVTAANGKTIVSVKIIYMIQNTGVLTLDGNNITSDTIVEVNAESITFGVGNTSDSVANGQVRITAIEVVYA